MCELCNSFTKYYNGIIEKECQVCSCNFSPCSTGIGIKLKIFQLTIQFMQLTQLIKKGRLIV